MREPAEHRDELDLVVAQALLVLAAVVVSGPALLIAVPVAIAIDRRGWRRWPALVTGAALTAAALAAGAWDTYLATGQELWRAAQQGARSRGRTCSGPPRSHSPPVSPSDRCCKSPLTIATSTRRRGTTAR